MYLPTYLINTFLIDLPKFNSVDEILKNIFVMYLPTYYKYNLLYWLLKKFTLTNYTN